MAVSKSSNYSTDVFVNCPFDDDFKPILDAITFAIHDSGYRARCALEANDTGIVRHDKIVKIIRQCQFGIHDLSRIEANHNEGQYPRFNMPYECGLFFGALKFGVGAQRKKQLLVLEAVPFLYQQVISDIAGNDVAAHENNPLKAIEHVRQFLTGKERGKLRGAAQMQHRFNTFMQELPTIAKSIKCTEDELRSLKYWPELTLCIAEWQESHP